MEVGEQDSWQYCQLRWHTRERKVKNCVFVWNYETQWVKDRG